MQIPSDIFREYDIRGVYKRDFDESFAEILGYYYVKYLQKNLNKSTINLSVGYDARLSSPSITQALCDGINKAGGHITLLDLITSPISYYSCFHLENLDGAFMVTGSHNPPDHNGFKISKGKTTIHGEIIQELRHLIQGNTLNLNQLSKSGSIKTYDILTPYIERYTKEFAGKFKNLKISYDCGNGAAGVIVPQMFEALQMKGEVLFQEPDGTFPNHHPDPTIEANLVDLKNSVLKHKCDVGVGFDGDGDRIGVVDDLGRHIYVDQFMILYAKTILKEYPKAPIIGDVKCSQVYYDKIAEYGGTPIMWKTGHSLIKEKVRDEKSPFGGELSGHIFFNDRNYGYDDALYASFRLLECLESENIKLSEFIDSLPKTFTSPELRIEVPEAEKFNIVDQLILKVRNSNTIGKIPLLDLNTLDGFRGLVDGGWALVRPSNTQPAVTIRFESSSQKSLLELKNEMAQVLDLNLDF
jgi:phosphomannomutase/phosphomannomutase/phosphoglucomutase